MKPIDANEFAANIDYHLRESLSETIVLTKAGRPCAIVRGLDYDDEQLQLVNSPEFWTMIEERRRAPTIPWEVAKQRLELLDD